MQYKLTVEELCMKLKPVFGKRMDELYMKYAMAESDEEREEIEHILNALYHKHLAELLDKKVLLEPPTKEDVSGEYPLAVVSYADKKLFNFNLKEKDWMRHVCISGMSGSGKTTLAFHIIKNFIERGKPFLIFDWKKSFRPLMLIDNEIMCFTVGNENISSLFRININEPPKGVAPKEWINVLCDLITESFFASYGVHKILLETLDEAFKDLGVYNGSRNYPTWNEIKWRLESRLEKTKGRTATWLESALRIAHVLTFGNFGKILNYKGKESLSIEDLLSKKVLFELNSLGSVEKKIFCEFILTYLYKLKKANQTGINNSFDNAILVDEAHNIFLKDKTHFMSESVTDVVYREMREYGTSLICLDQHISKISDTVSGNSACLIAFQQQLPQDIETISGLMQLREKKQYFSMLQVGTAIVKLSERYNLPFLVEVPNAELRSQEVSDYDVKTRMNAVFRGLSLEKGEDQEFTRKLKQEEVRIPNHASFNGEVQTFRQNDFKQEKVEEEIAEPEIQKPELPELNKVQEILLEFVDKKLKLGLDIRKIEKMLEESAIEGGYSIADVFTVVNYSLKNKFSKKEPVISPIIQTQKIIITPILETLSEPETKHEEKNILDDKEKFLIFLKNNEELNTIELYRNLGFSARKGNKIKNELLEEGKIKIEELKNNKGWKKIIRLI